MEEIKHLFCDEDGRIKRHKEYFDKNPYIKDAYLFISSIIKYITKKNSNPRHTNFLQQPVDKYVGKEYDTFYRTKIARDFYWGGACIKPDLSLSKRFTRGYAVFSGEPFYLF